MPPGAGDAREAVRRLLGVQAQDLGSARLALRARVPGLVGADVDAALADGSLVVGWLFRRTLHLMPAEDHGRLLALTAAAGIVGSRRRLAAEGLTDQQVRTALEVIGAALAWATRSRSELGDRLADAGVPAAGTCASPAPVRCRRRRS